MIGRILTRDISYNKITWYLQTQSDKVVSVTTDHPFNDYFLATEKQLEDINEHLMIDGIYNIKKMPDNWKFERYELRNEDVYKVEMEHMWAKWSFMEALEMETGELISEADVNFDDLIAKDMGYGEFVEYKDGKMIPTEEPDNFPPLKIGFFDIETDDRTEILNKSERKGFAKFDVARILSFSFITYNSNDIIHVRDNDEVKVLKELKKLMYDHHVNVAWNGESFDFKIKERFDLYNIPFNLNRFITLDHMKTTYVLDHKENYEFISLEKQAQRHLGMKKVYHKESFYEMFKNKPELLREYNNRDVEIMNELEKKLGYNKIIIDSAYRIGFLPEKYTYSRKSSIQAIMKASLNHHGKRIVWKSRSSIPTTQSFIGAVVLDAISNRWKNVLGIDLTSLYNSIMQTWNICPSQIVYYTGKEAIAKYENTGNTRWLDWDVKDQRSIRYLFRNYPEWSNDYLRKLENKKMFDISEGILMLINENALPDSYKNKNVYHDYSRYDHEGVMPRVLREFEKERNYYKELRNNTKDDELYKKYDTIQAGLKVVLLSIYGGIGARGSTKAKDTGRVSGAKSFYNRECAQDVTYFGQLIMEIVVNTVEEMGYMAVYGDTDSAYFYIGDNNYQLDEVKSILDNIVDKVNKNAQKLLDRYDIPQERRKINMEAQGWYNPFVLFDKKKKYFARMVYNAENNKYYDELEIYAKGVKMEKISEPDFIVNFQKEVYTKVLTYASEKEVRELIQTRYDELMNGKYDDDLVFYSKVRKKLSEYQNDTVVTTLARKLKEKGKFQEKSSLEYVITHRDMSGSPVADEVGSEIHRSGRAYVWDKRCKKWIDEVMAIAFSNQKSLDDFFSVSEENTVAEISDSEDKPTKQIDLNQFF